jgi:hypothetical protein
MTDHYILRASRIIPGKKIKLYVLDESTDALLPHAALLVLKKRGMTDSQARAHLRKLHYVHTRGA